MAASFPSFDSRTVTVDGVNLHYLCGGSGSPLVLVHGLGSSAAVGVIKDAVIEPAFQMDQILEKKVWAAE